MIVWPWTRDIQNLQQQVTKLMATAADQTAQINTLADKVTAINAAVTALKAQLGQTTPDQDAALTNLSNAIAALATTAGA